MYSCSNIGGRGERGLGGSLQKQLNQKDFKGGRQMLIIGPYREKEAHSAQFDTDMLARRVLVRKGLSSPFFLHFYKVIHDLFSFCILHDCRIIVHI